MRALPETRGTLHGEMVAFGCLAQLVLENYPKADIDGVIEFCIAVGLPVTLEQAGISDRTPEHLMPAAEAACKERPTRNSCSDLSPELVLGAFLGADALGENALGRLGK